MKIVRERALKASLRKGFPTQTPNEDFSKNRIGETYALRHLLAPKTAGDLDQRRLIRVIHLRQDQVSEEVLRSARLVVMAGVERPDACVMLLRDFVQQGGPLLLLAGGSFDPAAWQELLSETPSHVENLASCRVLSVTVSWGSR